MSDHDEIRAAVSANYAQAITGRTGSGCCGPATAGGAFAEMAGYATDELKILPAEVATSSFGCGNPLAFAEVQPGQTVVDLGSGAGLDLILAAQKVGPQGRVIGIDMTDEMLAKARENITKANLKNAEVRKGLIEDLPVESSTVDWLISNCVINLSPEKNRVFAEIARVLRPGGQLRVSDIVVQDLPDWVRKDAHLYSACVAGAITEEDYLKGLEAAGLENAQVTERLVYDADQLLALTAGDPAAGSACCGTTIPQDLARPIAEALAGKVWSAKFHAEKP